MKMPAAASAVSQRKAAIPAPVARKHAAPRPSAGHAAAPVKKPAAAPVKKKASSGAAKAAGKTAAMAKVVAKTASKAAVRTRNTAKPPRVAKPAARSKPPAKPVAKSRPTVTKAPNKPSRPLARPTRPAKPAAKAPAVALPLVHAAAPAVKPTTPAVPHATPAAPATVVKTAESPKPPAAAAVAAPHPTPAAHPATTVVALAPGAVAQPVRTPDPKSSAPPSVAPRSAPPRPMQGGMQNGRPIPPSRAAAKEEFFVEGDYVVYPTHGVGKVERIATEDIAGHRLELIHITFEENRMTLRVPVTKARSAGLRKLATRKMFDEAMGVLRGRARIKRTMWSRRAQEYEAKINSGDPIAIAEVVRDLHRNSGQPDQSFSERQIYEAAMDRLAAELAALDQTDKLVASVKLVNFLKTV